MAISDLRVGSGWCNGLHLSSWEGKRMEAPLGFGALHCAMFLLWTKPVHTK